MNGLSIFVTVVLFVLASQLSLVLHRSGAAPEQLEEAARQGLQQLDASQHRSPVVTL